MRALIIEDDDLKLARIHDFLVTLFPNLLVDVARSYKSGLLALVSDPRSIVLLDMTLPTFDILRGSDGGRPLALGGRELLRQMNRRGLHYPAVVITGFDSFGAETNVITLQQLDDDLAREFSDFYLGSVYFSSTSDDWKDRLRSIVSKHLDGDEE